MESMETEHVMNITSIRYILYMSKLFSFLGNCEFCFNL